MANRNFAYFFFGTDYDVLSSMTAARTGGFDDYVDSWSMLAEQIAGYRAAGILPPNRAAALVQSAWLAEQFPGCGLAAMGAKPQVRKGKPGRPRWHESEAVRNARHRARRREEFMADLAAIAPSPAAEPASDGGVGGYGNTTPRGQT